MSSEAVLPADGETPWPFADPENVATITLWRILRGDSPILWVTHDEDDGGWQFLDGRECSPADGAIVSMRSMFERDPTLVELADLPLGWEATRVGPGEPWQRGPVADRHGCADEEET
jgi:hypothetical protein